MAGRWQAGVVGATLALALGGCGLMAPRSSDGFADLDALGPFGVDNTMTLSIGPTLLHFAAAHTEDDPETRDLLRGLDGVRIRLYDIDGDPARIAARVDRMGRKLQDQGWAPVAVMQEDGETVHMLFKLTGEGRDQRIAGLTVLVADAEEAVIVNVMGELRPELFSDAMAALDVNVTPKIQVASATP